MQGSTPATIYDAVYKASARRLILPHETLQPFQ